MLEHVKHTCYTRVMNSISDLQVFGTVTVGERGQISLPQEAREKMGIEPGAKLLIVSGVFEGSLAIVPQSIVTDIIKGSYQNALERLMLAKENADD